MPFPRTVHSDKCIITTPDIFGKNYKQQFNKSNDNNSNTNTNSNTVHTQHNQIFNTINIKLKLPTNNNNNTSSSINTEFKLNLNDDIHKAINTHILTNNINPKYTNAIYQKVLKAINLLTSIPDSKLPKTSLKTLHDIHNITNLLSTTNTTTDDNNDTILDANTSFSYLIESTQYEKYISSLKPTYTDYEPYHKLSSTI
jgi:signal recognition particle GTPase